MRMCWRTLHRPARVAVTAKGRPEVFSSMPLPPLLTRPMRTYEAVPGHMALDLAFRVVLSALAVSELTDQRVCIQAARVPR